MATLYYIHCLFQRLGGIDTPVKTAVNPLVLYPVEKARFGKSRDPSLARVAREVLGPRAGSDLTWVRSRGQICPRTSSKVWFDLGLVLNCPPLRRICLETEWFVHEMTLFDHFLRVKKVYYRVLTVKSGQKGCFSTTF